jgi:hypothetical protein
MALRLLSRLVTTRLGTTVVLQYRYATTSLSKSTATLTTLFKINRFLGETVKGGDSSATQIESKF